MQEKIVLETPRGFRDFPPEEKILRDEVISKLKNAFERYGFLPLETPVLEKQEILDVKFGAGESSDAISEIYRLKDQGQRKLGLRFEFTTSLARFVGQNKQLPFPFKRYQIGPVFRDGPLKPGRYREFYQCDADIVGSSELIADAETISLIPFVFKDLDLEITIEINDRRLLKDFLDFLKIPLELHSKCIIIMDKLKKIGNQGVTNELLEIGIDNKTISKLLELITQKPTNQDTLLNIKNILGEIPSILALENLFSLLEVYKVDFVFSPSLARGLGYYTASIFEVYLKDDSYISSSIAAGGRWDNLISKYLQTSSNEYPAVGVSFGLEAIIDAIKQKKGIVKKTLTKLFIIPIGKKNIEKAILFTQSLRSQSLNISMDLVYRSVSKNIEFAVKQNIPFVGFLGDDEISQNKLKIRDLKSGKEELLSLQEIFSFLSKS